MRLGSERENTLFLILIVLIDALVLALGVITGLEFCTIPFLVLFPIFALAQVAPY
jgi:hypothetical protein